MKTIYFIRHAHAEGQPFDSALTKKGREQADALIAFFSEKEINRIYSSPYLRAIETISPLAKSRGMDILEDERLGERMLSSSYFDDWQDKLRESFADFDLCFEGGESHAQAMERVQSILEDVILSEDQNIILVSHGNLTTLMLRYFDDRFGFEQLMNMTNPDVFEILIHNDEVKLNRIWK
ncbi:histidine phosphatase family protein [Bacillus sp. S/N-304-OC-R1]|nr:histidine phosphatase family protein [Bacillus sp. S/N-304-OC-R1]